MTVHKMFNYTQFHKGVKLPLVCYTYVCLTSMFQLGHVYVEAQIK